MPNMASTTKWSNFVFESSNEEFMEDLLKEDGDFLIRRSFVWEPLGVVVRSKNAVKTCAPFIHGTKYGFGEALFKCFDDLITHHYEKHIPLDTKGKLILKRHIKPDSMATSISLDDVKHVEIMKTTQWARSSCVDWKQERLLMKVISRRSQSSEDDDTPLFQSLVKQYEYVTELRHNNLCRYLGLINSDEMGQAKLFFEWLPGPSVEQLLKTGPLSENEIVRILLHVARALVYLHRHTIAHRHVTPCKVFRRADANCYTLSGLWWCKFDRLNQNCSDDTLNNLRLPPLKCQSPEAASKGSFTKFCDTWNFGVFVYEILPGGGEPYKEQKPDALKGFIGNGGNPGRLENVRDEFNDLMTLCWQKNPNDRPFMEVVVEKLEKMARRLKFDIL